VGVRASNRPLPKRQPAAAIARRCRHADQPQNPGSVQQQAEESARRARRAHPAAVSAGVGVAASRSFQ